MDVKTGEGTENMGYKTGNDSARRGSRARGQGRPVQKDVISLSVLLLLAISGTSSV